MLERILSRENLNKAYKRVRANKGAPGIDGMTVEETLPWLREHREELLETIRQGNIFSISEECKALEKIGWALHKFFETFTLYR